MVELVHSPTPLEIDGVAFPAFATPPDSSSSDSKPPLFLAGAGARGLDIGGRFVKFTAIGIYLEEPALHLLAPKWPASTPDQLAAAPDFFADIIHGPFDKFVRVTMILPLTGEQYSEKVAENCVAHWKAIGIFTEAEADAVDKFKQVFKPETFPPGSSIIFTHSASGTLSIAFSKDSSVPESNKAVIGNKALCCAVIESIIGEHGVSPATKSSIAVRFCEHLKLQSPVQNQEQVQQQQETTVSIDA